MSIRVLLVWGLLEGIFAALVERVLFRIAEIATLLITVAIGLVLTLVFIAPVPRSRWLVRALGFCAVATLIPIVTVIVGNSPYYGRLTFSLDPIAIMVALIWALVLLPFALVSTIVNWRLSHE